MARAQDDGYRNPLVPGLRATADAERLAGALVDAAERLEPPGPYEAVAAEPDLEQATWLAFLLALIGPDAPDAQARLAEAPPRWEDGDLSGVPDTFARGIGSYRQWAARAGSQAAAFTGEPDWTPQRRFARVFERLALPGLTRATRFEYSPRSAPRSSIPSRPTRSSSAWRTMRRRWPPSGCCSRATACCSSGVRATWRPPPSCRSPRSTAAWRCGGPPVPTST